jgi:hypothetical protein
MTSSKTVGGVKIRSGLKGGKLAANHTRAGLKVASDGKIRQLYV